jgi:molybdate transport system substrate-binding protein
MKRFYSLERLVFTVLIPFAVCCTDVTAQDPAATNKKTIVVFAAASTTNALDEIKREFGKKNGIEVQTSYAASAPLANQIVNGAEADIFISADTKWADYLAEKKLVAQSRDVLGNRLVIVTPIDAKQNIKKPEDLSAKGVEHIAIGEPGSVPAGKYAKAALMKLNLWDKLKEKFVPGQDVRHALTYVETGAAEAGIVYATDAAISKKIKIAIELSEELTGPIRYPIALLSKGEKKSEAKVFFEYLRSPESIKIFKKYGFSIQTP